MNKRNIFKLILDISMIILFITFFDKNFINMHFHMHGGMIFGVFILIHMIINRKWIISISKRLLSKNTKLKARLSYIVSFLLLVSIFLIIASGFGIIFASVNRKLFWKILHYTCSYISIALIGIHLGLYWRWVMNVFKKIFKISKESQIRVIMSKLLVVLVLVMGLYTMYNKSYLKMTISGSTYIVQNITYDEDNQETEEFSIGEEYISQKSSLAKLASTYGSMISVFGIGVYYTDKYLKSKNQKTTKISKIA